MKKFTIFFDIDGVLKHGEKPIKGAKEAIEKLRNNKISLCLITNAGGEFEYTRASKINNILQLSEEYSIKKNEIVMSQTAFQGISNKNKMILLAGKGEYESILVSYGFKNYITLDEYCILYNQTLGYNMKHSINYDLNDIMNIKSRVENRLGFKLNCLSNSYIEPFIPIESIYIFSSFIRWEVACQIMMDILISNNGVPGSISEKQVVDLHVAANDLTYKIDFPINRLSGGAYLKCLENLFYLTYNKAIDYTLYGKPSNLPFKYAMTLNQNSNRFYMIGDSPEVDIKGAKECGIETILVKTGVWNKEYNHELYPGDHYVSNVEEAINIIFKKENLI